jgi:hypothetical protein
MRRTQSVAISLLAFCLAGCGASRKSSSFSANTGSNNTTVASLTVNNTSTANNFASQSNGNFGASNVSKLDIHSLLYAGAQTKILAQLLLWFGQSGHMNVGYSSNDAAQVKRQIEDMISRGIDGVIVDWYGPSNTIDTATQLVMQEAEKHAGFSFAIMIDAGAIGSNGCNGCNPQQTLVNLMKYVEQHYFPSSAYLNVQGQPIITNFNIDYDYQIDWQAANAQLHTPPRLIFQNQEGFTRSLSDGSYSWVMPQIGDFGLTYLSSFYATGLEFSNEKTVGAAYKGFNDSLAPWGSSRFMDQQCGQTWLQTFAQVNALFNQGRQLPYLQIVTWNDYEEGTEIESGIDSCFGLQASVSGNQLQWSTAGYESNIDHYSIYTSTDGKSISKLTDVPTGTHSADLCSLGVGSGNYQLFVQAVGKPSFANRMPGPLSYKGSCGN